MQDGHDYDNRRRQVTEQARATLRRLEVRDRERALERHLQGPVDVEPPIADYRGCRSTREMSARQFSKWCDDGRPPLKEPVAMVPKAKVDDMIRAAAAAERANLQASLQTLAEIIGDETGKADAKLAKQIEQLRAELDALRAEQRGAVLDLPPDWRSHVSH